MFRRYFKLAILYYLLMYIRHYNDQSDVPNFKIGPIRTGRMSINQSNYVYIAKYRIPGRQHDFRVDYYNIRYHNVYIKYTSVYYTARKRVSVRVSDEGG